MTSTTESYEIPDAMWQAVVRRDRRHDSKFVYAALSTGIYCRPSCPARHPHRRNTLIFSSAKQAEKEGFIPCRRCHPAEGSSTPAEQSIKATLNYIEACAGQNITLKALSQVTGVSPNHLQQTFRDIVGVSPKTYCNARHLARLRERLRKGASVVNALYDSGFGSTRALYELASWGLGMPPAMYARGAPGIKIRYATVESATGHVLLAATDRGICAINEGSDSELLENHLLREFPDAKLVRELTVPPRWVMVVRICQSDDAFLNSLSPELRRKVFDARLREALGEQPLGATPTDGKGVEQKKQRPVQEVTKNREPSAGISREQRIAIVRPPVENR